MKKALFSKFLLSLTLIGNSIYGSEAVTPESALKELMDGNKRYTQDLLEHPNRTSERREALTSSQNPFAVIVGCSDSRVSPEIIFDQGIGDIFVVRIAGNVVGPVAVASVDYGAAFLGASIVMVLGHENCGAVKAVMAGKTSGIEPIAEKIQSAIKTELKKPNVTTEEAIKANVKAAVEQLRKFPPLAKLIQEKKLAIVGGYYKLSTGEVEICCSQSE